MADQTLRTLTETTSVAGNTIMIVRLDGQTSDQKSTLSTLTTFLQSALTIPANTSDLVNDSGFLVTVSESDVTQHQAALSITESQISDLGNYIENIADDTTPQLGGSLDGQGNEVTDIARSINTQTGTSYTLVAGDATKYLRFTNASAVTVTVPENSSVAFAIGTEICIRQVGAGKVTLAGAGSVTVNSPETLSIEKQNATATLIKVGPDSWELDGRLEASA